MSYSMMPKFHPTGLSNVRAYLQKKQQLRSLEHDEKIPVIKSNCPSLDWITDCGGLPRGRVVVVGGPESSGKCVDFNTYIPVYGRGLVKVKDIAADLNWNVINGEVIPDQSVGVDLYVTDEESQPVKANAVYFAGTLESHRVMTEDGNELIGAKTHRVLSLTSGGILSWSMLRDLRCSDILVKTVGQKVSGTRDKIFQWSLPVDNEELTIKGASTASFFGAMSGIERRDESLYILVTSPNQVKMIKQWAREMVGDEDPSVDPFDQDVAEFSRFSGLVRIKRGRWSDLALETVNKVPKIIRESSLIAQVHWCAGLTISRGVWTQNDFEVELESEEVAKTLHMVLENLGVRAIIYRSLDTFSRERWKVALRDRIAQQEAQEIIWKGYTLPPDWRGESVLEKVETHEYMRKTLERAIEALRLEGFNEQADSIDVDDLDKDTLTGVAELMFTLSRKKKSFDRIYQTLKLIGSPFVCLDRVTFSKATGVETPMADLSVPIGSLYSTAGLISHNSTLAMHMANQELSSNPNAVAVFQDYEHSMAVNYARKMGLHKHGDRFLLIPSHEFEEADSLVKIFIEQKVYPALWIIDSVPAMVPAAAFERETDENPQVALQARLLSDLLARWVKTASKYGITFLLLNQIRARIAIGWGERGKAKVGVPGSDKENPTGGFAVRFYSSLTIDLRPSKIVKANVFNPMLGEKEDIPIANMVKMTTVKNKCGSPHKSAMAYIQFGEGIDTVRTVIDMAITQRLVTVHNKSTYEVILPNSERLSVVGKEKFVSALKGYSHGVLGSAACEYLMKELQWDKADEIHSQVLGLTEENVDSGEETSIGDEDVVGVASEGLLELLLSQDSLMEQADTLNMLTRRSKTIYWTNPKTGVEFRGQRLELLEGKLDEESRELLERIILEKINEIEMQLEQQQRSTEGTASEGMAIEGSVPGGSVETAQGGSQEGFEGGVVGNGFEGGGESQGEIEGYMETEGDGGGFIDSIFRDNNQNDVIEEDLE